MIRWARLSIGIVGLSVVVVAAGHGPARAEDSPVSPGETGGVVVEQSEASGEPVLAADLMGGEDLPVTLEWCRSVFGEGIGGVGLNVVDLDGNGKADAVASAWGEDGVSHWWYVLSYDGSGYPQRYVCPTYTSSMDSLRTADINGDGDVEIVVGAGNQVLAYDGQTFELISTVTTTAANIRGLTIADVDADGQLEYVFCDSTALYVYGIASGLEEYKGSGYGGSNTAVANVDGDPGLEIVVGNGTSTGYVLNGVTRAEEWSYASGFGSLIETGDLDGDGMEEIAGVRSSSVIVFDADLQLPKTTVPTDMDADALRLADVEGDGPLEIVYGDQQWGSLYVYNGQTGVLKWSVQNPEHGVTDVAVGDTDGDGVNELLWGAGYDSTGSDYLYVVDTATRQQEWRSDHHDGPFYALDYGDVDNDGAPELLSGCYETESGYEGGLYFVHDALTKELEYQSGHPTANSMMGLWRVRYANIDDDPQGEILVTTDNLTTGMIICYDGITHAEQWRATIPSGAGFCSMDVADVDADSVPEVVAGVFRDSTGAAGVYLYVFNARTGAEEWHSENLGTYWASLSLLRIADVDGDDHLEMLVAELGGQLFVYDGQTHVQQLQTADLNITALETADVDGNGTADIIIGTTGGEIQVLDPTTGAISQTIFDYGKAIDGLAAVDVMNNGRLDWILGMDKELFVCSGSIPWLVKWRSGKIGTSVGSNDSLMVADIDGDGRTEITVNVGRRGFHVYEIGNVGPTPKDFRYSAVVRKTPSDRDIGLLPTEIAALQPGETFYVELWATDEGVTNTGLACVFADLVYDPSSVTVGAISPAGSFEQVGGGGMDNGAGRISGLGGCSSAAGVGVSPQWACVARVLMTVIPSNTTPTCGSVPLQFVLEPASAASTAYGRGTVAAESIVYGTGELDRTCMYDLTGDCQVVAEDVLIIIPSWMKAEGDTGFDPRADFDGSGRFSAGDVGFLATAWLKSCGDPSVVFPPYQAMSDGPGPVAAADVGGALQYALRLTTTYSSTQVISGSLPEGTSSVTSGQYAYAEFWVRDTRPGSGGVVAAYADLAFDSNQFQVMAKVVGSLYYVFQTGTIETTRVSQFGGATLDGNLAVGQWVRVGIVRLKAKVDVTLPGLSLTPASVDPAARYGLGSVPTSDIRIINCIRGYRTADLDGDEDVDGFDFLTFANCYNGSDRPALSACQNPGADLEGDDDVDGFDFLTFANCYNGSDRRSLCP